MSRCTGLCSDSVQDTTKTLYRYCWGSHSVQTCDRQQCALHRTSVHASCYLQVLVAACVKIGVKPPKDAEQLYEVDQQGSIVRGSRKMQHSNQLRCAAAPLPCSALFVLQRALAWKGKNEKKNHRKASSVAEACWLGRGRAPPGVKATRAFWASVCCNISGLNASARGDHAPFLLVSDTSTENILWLLRLSRSNTL